MTLTGQEVRPPEALEASTPSPEPERTPAPRRPRLLILDVVRLLAALMVVAWHLIAAAKPAWEQPTVELFGWAAKAARYGWLGVPLFFLISGFVIVMSSWGRSLGEFAISRVVRLFPAYWLAIIATTAVMVLFPAHRHHLGAHDTLANLTMLQRLLGIPNVDRSYWTLAIELQFYLLFAVVVWRGVTYKRTVAFCGIWLVAAVTFPALGAPLAGTWASYFVGGIALYLIYKFGQSLLLWGMVVMSWLLSLVHLKGTIVVFLGKTEPFWPSALIVTACYLLMAAIALDWFRWFTWKGAVTAGALTYPLYLLHQEIGLTIIRRTHGAMPAWALLASVVAAMMVLAWLVHKLVEVPVARWLKRGLTDALHKVRAIDGEGPAAGGTGAGGTGGGAATAHAAIPAPRTPVERHDAGTGMPVPAAPAEQLR